MAKLSMKIQHTGSLLFVLANGMKVALAELPAPSTHRHRTTRIRMNNENNRGKTCSDNDLNTQGVQDNAECWPDRTSSVTQTNKELRGWGYYSPGISCPAGYEKRCSATGTADVSGFTFQFPLLESETGIGCCPTGYTCKFDWDADHAHTCYSIATTGSFPAVFCPSGKSNSFRYLELPTAAIVTGSGEDSVTVISTMILNAPLFQLIHQSTDITSSSHTATATGQSRISGTGTPANNSENGGLSIAAKAGIGGGVSGGVLLVIMAISFFLWKRNRVRGAVSTTEDPAPSVLKPELPAESVPRLDLNTPAISATVRSELA
ncbi:hypothetical protein EDB81DRAFT_913280 [Dactylonectria macrodidyma]|uniref:Uncharacterized protein n=1 Tax=Dactylonectria macrodidyma TaxID=307937 RepID=A0A9P9DPZ0_9HYPO|nr:hypothetical protein EDB81DRAFT_913280 [Dactylonectria macrodidyma]